MMIVCPGCGTRFDPAASYPAGLSVIAPGEVPMPGVTAKREARELLEDQLELLADGTAMRPLTPDDGERHVDMRLRCPTCSIHQR